MIKISTLQLISSPEQFFKTDKILLIQFLELPVNSKMARDTMKINMCIRVGELLYVPVILRGSPYNLVTNAVEGIPFKLTKKLDVIVQFDGNVRKAIQEKRLYDFTADYYWTKGIRNILDKEPEFFVERFFPNVKETYTVYS